MFKKSYYLLFVLILLWESSCNNEKKTCIDTYSLVAHDNSIVIKHDSLSSPNDCKIFYFVTDKKEESIYALNKLNNSIDLYSIKGDLIKRIKLEKEGPNGVGIASNFFVKSPDSIFVLATFQYSVSLINANGKLQRKYSYLFNDTGKERLGNGLISYGNDANQMMVKDNFLYAGASPFDDPTLRRYYNKANASLVLNMLSGKADFLTTLPEKWLKTYDEGYALTGIQTELSQTYNTEKGKCVISYNVDESIYEVDMNTKNTKSYQANSCFFGEIPWYKKSKAVQHDVNDEFNYVTSQPHYSSIYYDKYRKMYLRFAGTPNKNKKSEYDDKVWFIYSVIILNENFEKVGETKLDENYQSSNLFVTEKGIYIKHYKKDDEHSYFTLFTIQENE